MEKDYRAIFEKYGFGTTVVSPLAQGFLSGKYNDGNIPDDSRVAKLDPLFKEWLLQKNFSGDGKIKLLKICKSLAEIAKSEGYTQA